MNMYEDNKIEIEVVSFNDAHAFLDYLRPSKPHWGNSSWHNGWFFRGQSNPIENSQEKWKLLPSAWRGKYEKATFPSDDSQQTYISWLKDHFANDDIKFQNSEWVANQAYAEYYAIEEFVKLANSNAIYLPDLAGWREITQSFLAHYIHNIIKSDFVKNSKIWRHPIVALAQHHGIPTRLLDWTHNPIIAAYFSVLSYNKSSDIEKKTTENIVIYAYHKLIIDLPNNYFIRKIDVPDADNEYSHHQKGFLLLIDSADDYFIKNSHFLTFDKAFRITQIEDTDILVKNPYRKIILPISEIKELERMLWLEDITLAHLMPNLDNVAKTVKNRFNIR